MNNKIKNLSILSWNQNKTSFCVLMLLVCTFVCAWKQKTWFGTSWGFLVFIYVKLIGPFMFMCLELIDFCMLPCLECAYYACYIER